MCAFVCVSTLLNCVCVCVSEPVFAFVHLLCLNVTRWVLLTVRLLQLCVHFYALNYSFVTLDVEVDNVSTLHPVPNVNTFAKSREYDGTRVFHKAFSVLK